MSNGRWHNIENGIKELKDRATALKAENDRLAGENSDLKTQVANLQHELGDVQAQLTAQTQEIVNLESMLQGPDGGPD